MLLCSIPDALLSVRRSCSVLLSSPLPSLQLRSRAPLLPSPRSLLSSPPPYPDSATRSIRLFLSRSPLGPSISLSRLLLLAPLARSSPFCPCRSPFFSRQPPQSRKTRVPLSSSSFARGPTKLSPRRNIRFKGIPFRSRGTVRQRGKGFQKCA